MDGQSSGPDLAADLRRVAALLEPHAANADPEAGAARDDTPIERPDGRDGSPLDMLCGTFGLTDFERDVLLLCAGVELDADCAALVARIQQGAPPTAAMALAALPEAHWSAMLPTGPLRYWRLIELAPASSLVGSALRIDERILHYLVGLQFIDERLAGIVEVAEPPAELLSSQRTLAERISAVWRAALEARAAVPAVQLCGDDPSARRDVAALACALGGSPLLVLHAADLPEDLEASARIERLWEREALLVSGGRMLVADADGGRKGADRRIERLVEGASGPLIVSSPVRRPAGERTLLSFDVARPEPEERLETWREALGTEAPAAEAALRTLAFQFDLDLAAMRAAAADALAAVAAAGDTGLDLAGALWENCRRQARAGISDGVQLIDPAARPDDLVLPPRERQTIDAIVAQVRHRATVYGDWGFAESGGRGLGLAALFAGPSGTGKTLAAETIAGELRLDLLRIDLSAVVDKYIGETEKRLKRVFDAAEAGGAVLLFDEADALFGKRSEVKDSHDRHANIEVAYLLQRIEAYRGLAILTTNLKDNLDQAFLRRLRFIVQFPFPDAAQRARIWQRAFPPQTPLEGLDHERLAQLNVTGGSIRNIALNAAFAAAAEAKPVSMTQIKAAARAEYAKLGATLTDGETRGW
jgi:hypothetical protein